MHSWVSWKGCCLDDRGVDVDRSGLILHARMVGDWSCRNGCSMVAQINPGASKLSGFAHTGRFEDAFFIEGGVEVAHTDTTASESPTALVSPL